MKSGTMLRIGAVVLFALLEIAAQPSVWGQSFTNFDPPGSISATPTGINPAGQIVGNFSDPITNHGFLRDTDGTITVLDAPGAVPGPAFPNGTSVSLITPRGLIVGTYFDANSASHLFLRQKDGTFTTLVVPGAAGFGGIVGNTEGAIAGIFFDSNNNPNGFLRAPSGKFTLFEFPPAFVVFSIFPGFPPAPPSIVGMTPGGTILGSYLDVNGATHGFLRTIDGTFTTFDAPNAIPGFFSGTTPTSINNSGVATGWYFDSQFVLHYFLRAPDGTFTAFTPPPGSFGSSADINSSGAIAGSVQVAGNTLPPVSFLRTATGTISTISDPEGVQGTVAVAINPAGVITGFYLDANSQGHGFVVKP